MLEKELQLTAHDTRKQIDQLIREILIIKHTMKKQNENSRRYTMCCPTPVPAHAINKLEYI